MLLTTQYLDEADQLADDRGHRPRLGHRGGTPDELKRQVGEDRVELTLTHADDLTRAREALLPIATGEVVVDARSRTVVVPVAGGYRTLVDAVRRLEVDALAVSDIGLRRPTLDDVFLSLTGRNTEATEDGGRPTPEPPSPSR